MKDIFEKQNELATKFKEIEKLNGYEPLAYPVDLQSRSGQDRMRMFYAFFCEEVAEANAASDEEFPMELSDILHFATEIALMAGVTPSDVEFHAKMDAMDAEPAEYGILDVLCNMGMGMNQMKAKPWKNQPKPTDEAALKSYVSRAIHELNCVIRGFDLNPKELYFMKHRVNEQRIADGV